MEREDNFVETVFSEDEGEGKSIDSSDQIDLFGTSLVAERIVAARDRKSTLCIVCDKRGRVKGRETCHNSFCRKRSLLNHFCSNKKRSRCTRTVADGCLDCNPKKTHKDSPLYMELAYGQLDQNSEGTDEDTSSEYSLSQSDSSDTSDCTLEETTDENETDTEDLLLIDDSGDQEYDFNDDDSNHGDDGDNEADPGYIEDSDENSDEEDEEVDLVPLADEVPVECCSNCRRSEYQPLPHESPMYGVRLIDVDVDNIRFRKKFSHLNRSSIPASATAISVCEECSIYLQRDESLAGASSTLSKICWPAYLFGCLKNIGSDMSCYVWTLLPTSLRDRWSHAFPTYCADPTQSVIRDITSDRDDFFEKVNSYKLGGLLNAVETHLLPNVLCPWGCTEYCFRVGELPLDVTLNRYFSGGDLPMMREARSMNKARSSRDDFIRSDRNEYTPLLANEKWPVLPCMYMSKSQGMVFATCRHHKHGTTDQYLHLPRQPQRYIVPTKEPDQLSHAVVKPRTIRSMKRKKYNTSYDTMKAVASYGGIDTCDVISSGRFNFMSILSQEKESLSIKGRSDTQFLLGKLVKDGVISEEYAQHMRESSDLWYPDEEKLQECTRAATYVTFVDAVILQSNLRIPAVCSVKEPNQNGGGFRTIEFKPSWPRHIFWLHKNDCYGGCFTPIPKFFDNTVDTRLLWNVVSLVASLPSLWKSTVESVQHTTDWSGHILQYVAAQCFPAMKTRGCAFQGEKYPFGDRTNAKALATKLSPGGKVVAYSAKQLTQVFQKHKSVIVMQMQNNLVTAIQNKCNNTSAQRRAQLDTVIIHQDFQDGTAELSTRLPPETILIEGNDYELRYVFISCPDPSNDNKWSGKLFVRHGGEMFPNWWGQQRAANGKLMSRK